MQWTQKMAEKAVSEYYCKEETFWGREVDVGLNFNLVFLLQSDRNRPNLDGVLACYSTDGETLKARIPECDIEIHDHRGDAIVYSIKGDPRMHRFNPLGILEEKPEPPPPPKPAIQRKAYTQVIDGEDCND